jgi:demethylmenaquinone methyltransferase/2-methoxy-6-polyprenyl-1,4-benzoquinol methylase
MDQDTRAGRGGRIDYAGQVPFRASFACLWCGRPWAAAAPDALEGWAQLCPDCLGRAGDNGFLRARLHVAITERGRAGVASMVTATAPATQPALDVATDPATDPVTRPVAAVVTDPPAGPAAETVAYDEARAGEEDDWYLRRGRYDHGPIDNLAWTMDLDRATLWLDGLPLGGRIVELAAGTGWWSPLLAGKGELWCYDAAGPLLDRARERLVAHHLRAHLHVRDAWAAPVPPPAAALFTGFWLSHVPRVRLDAFLAVARGWLKPGGTFAFIDSRPDPASGAPDPDWDAATETSQRRLADGRSFTIPEVVHTPDGLRSALARAGFAEVEVQATARFFLLGSGRAGPD